MNKLETIEAFYGNLTSNNTFTLEGEYELAHPFRATLVFWATDPEWTDLGLQGERHGAYIDTIGGIETVHVTVWGEQPADMLVALHEACERNGAWAWNQRNREESQ